MWVAPPSHPRSNDDSPPSSNPKGGTVTSGQRNAPGETVVGYPHSVRDIPRNHRHLRSLSKRVTQTDLIAPQRLSEDRRLRHGNRETVLSSETNPKGPTTEEIEVKTLYTRFILFYFVFGPLCVSISRKFRDVPVSKVGHTKEEKHKVSEEYK